MRQPTPFLLRETNLGRIAAVLIASGLFTTALAQVENYDAWPLLVNPFESTSGGGVMIGGYEPKIVGNTCVTDFTVTLPAGEVIKNTIVFAAVPVAGGTLCNEGKWRALDGSNSGTTPFRVFLKDGVTRRSP